MRKRKAGVSHARKGSPCVYKNLEVSANTDEEYFPFAEKSSLTFLKYSEFPSQPHLGVLQPTTVNTSLENHEGPLLPQ